MADGQTILVLNSGSSSIKFGVYAIEPEGERLLLSGAADRIGGPSGHFEAKDASGQTRIEESPALPDAAAGFLHLAGALKRLEHRAPAAIGHRVVHGGPNLLAHCRITPGVEQEIRRYASFAPLHTGPTLDILEQTESLFPGVPGFACFDTAFHAHMPEVSRRLAIPESFAAQGIRRYGFHGLSCESIVDALERENALPARLVVAHLGNGASITAIRDGRSVENTMGLTPTGGILSGTRSGDIDPGVAIYILRALAREHASAAAAAGELEAIFNRSSGLAGISTETNDMQALEKNAAKGDPSAQLAVAAFTHSILKAIGGYAALLGGIDLLVFAGGIGEHDAALRRSLCRQLSFLGLEEGKGRVRVLEAEENRMIARHTRRLLAG